MEIRVKPSEAIILRFLMMSFARLSLAAALAIGATSVDVAKEAGNERLGLPSCMALKTSHGRFVTGTWTLLNYVGGALECDRTWMKAWEKFTVRDHLGGISLQASSGKYVAAEKGGGLNANRPHASTWEKFDVVHNDDGSISLKTHWEQYVGAPGSSWGQKMVARNAPKDGEIQSAEVRFTVVPC